MQDQNDEPGDLAASRGPSRALVIGVVSALVVMATAAIFIAGSVGGSQATPVTLGQRTPAQEEVNALFAGIPQSGNALGDPGAPVTLQFFGDLQCPTARDFTLVSLPTIIGEWVRAGTVRIEFRSLRSVSEPEAFDAQQVAALAAGMQNKLWDYLEYFYLEQGQEHTNYVTGSYLRSLAREVSGLDFEQWNEERDDPQLVTQMNEDEQLAQATQLSGTPSFLIGPTGSTPIYSMGESATLEEINGILKRVLHEQRS